MERQNAQKNHKAFQGNGRFLKEEAFEEQGKGLNTTHLFIDKETGKIAAYISLCNDSIGLELEERDNMGLPYDTPISMRIGLEEYLERIEAE